MAPFYSPVTIMVMGLLVGVDETYEQLAIASFRLQQGKKLTSPVV